MQNFEFRKSDNHRPSDRDINDGNKDRKRYMMPDRNIGADCIRCSFISFSIKLAQIMGNIFPPQVPKIKHTWVSFIFPIFYIIIFHYTVTFFPISHMFSTIISSSNVILYRYIFVIPIPPLSSALL